MINKHSVASHRKSAIDALKITQSQSRESGSTKSSSIIHARGKIYTCITYTILLFLLDAFLRNRSSSDHEVTAMMKAQFLSLWDGLDTDNNCQVL